MSTHT